ncbi:AraC family transcriptional regulator [Enterococcus termitis]|uniref:AraC family transcriptional regulator n=2 Tax=Enterococcus termitis TaxID=332950 RepID=A0A1E5G6R8_9ENTE|nr:helix-turn-helix domain-containing protein [Enterococcus termitis]OEG08392.1 AraC family transcriptional regulator [Enterococcus termitis]OJG98012.1 hypothetical protein RV18_GL003708 [Enterococcus termitis]
MHAWEAIQKSIDYIESNLTEEVSIEKLAEMAGLSPFYFQRLFSRLVQKPVFEYVKLRRLAQAVSDLKTNNTRILDTAMDYGFSSHANFTRAFKEVYGITPDKYRTTDIQLNQFVKPDLMLNYVMVDENVPLVTDGIVLEVTRKKLDKPRTFIGIAKEIPLSELMGGTNTGVSFAAKLWDEFHEVKAKIPYLLANGNKLGALYMGGAKKDHCTYLAGAEVEYGSVIEGYTVFELPDSDYLVCGFEAVNFEELTNSAVYKAQTFMERWMKEHKLSTTDFAVEMYYPVTDGRAYMEHWVQPVPIKE